MEYQLLIEKQKKFYHLGLTKTYAFRIASLKALKKAIISHEEAIFDALKKDLGKSSTESFMTEVGVVLSEISFAIKHLKSWMKPKKVKTPLTLYKAKSYHVSEPLGTVLILAPWNYPFQLTMNPIVGAIAAGNTVIAKPSSSSKHTAQVIYDIINSIFDDQYVNVILGSASEADKVLEHKVDYIFFTGSIPIGKVIMQKASQHLTPVTLELGGKSPCIIDDHVDLDLAAKRIVFGKFINAGQTCIAPDYLYIKESQKEAFTKAFKKYVAIFYGESPITNESYPKIINERHVTRLKSYLDEGVILAGGKSENQKIEPTLVDQITWKSKIMQDEIFGPILPMITYENLDEIISTLQNKDKPLALYLFTKSREVKKKVIHSISFGGGTINDTLMHFVNHHMGFGGVGYSGMGSYHGHQSFKTFSHDKSIVDRATWIDLYVRYHPLNESKMSIFRKLMK